MESDSLHFVPMENWVDLEKVFLADWPRGIQAYNALVTQRKLSELGLGYGFKVYCPYGDVSNGMVAINRKDTFNEVIIQCPKDDTKPLEEALIATRVISWSDAIIVPYLPDHLLPCVQRVAEKVGMECEGDEYHAPHYLVVFSKENSPFQNISLPEDMKFQPISEKDIEVIDPLWPNRYDSSQWFFNILIKLKTGYGLYKNNELVAWVFINEIGGLAHLFTLESHRKKGYAKILMQLVCNARIKENRDVFAFCLNVNYSALKLYESLGFKKMHPVQWMVLLPKSISNPNNE